MLLNRTVHDSVTTVRLRRR